jgi:RNA polymerase sigma factor (sigma-70 family)
LNSLSDNALMLKVKTGDLDRMGLLFERHYKPLFGFLYRMSSDKENSEDMAQNVFLRMLKYRHTYKGDGEFKTWMYHLARNVLNDFHKSQSKRSDSEIKDNLLSEDTTQVNIEKNEQVQLLNTALSKLGDEHREILILNRYQELDYKEIAVILNISEANVRVKIHRAMTQLKSMFHKLAD